MSDLTIRRVPDLTVPTIHLNGSDPSRLIERYVDALHQIRQAHAALAATAPHGRDYYVSQHPDALTRAELEHTVRLTRLTRIIDELEVIIHGIDEQTTR